MASNAPRQRRRLRQPWQCGFCNLQNLKEAEEFEENPDPVLSQNWIRELAELCGDFDAADVPHPAVSADGELHLTGRESWNACRTTGETIKEPTRRPTPHGLAAVPHPVGSR